jgi:hypothetical protein
MIVLARFKRAIINIGPGNKGASLIRLRRIQVLHHWHLVILEKFQDCQDDVVDVTESRGLGLFGVVKAASPVDGDVSGLPVQLDGSSNGAAYG